MRDLHRFGSLDFLPDRTLVLTLDESEGALRARARDGHLGDRIGSRPPSYHAAVDAGFRAMAAKEPDRVKLIDAAGRRRPSPPGCSTRWAICCHDRRPGQGGRSLCQRLGIAAAAPCLAAGRAQGGRQGELRQVGRNTGAGRGGGPAVELAGLETPADHPIARLLAAGSHPDFRWLERLEKPTGGLARNISVDQVRSLGDLLAVTPSMSPWRAIVIDSADDLEASAANALLKMLEEPPANTLFFLVSHAPGRLLPTIRSRCRRLDFGRIADDAMTSLLSRSLPNENPSRIAELVQFANGSIGRALAIAELDLAPLEGEALTILRQGDPDNARRSKLAAALGPKAAAERYAAFLELVRA